MSDLMIFAKLAQLKSLSNPRTDDELQMYYQLANCYWQYALAQKLTFFETMSYGEHVILASDEKSRRRRAKSHIV